MLNTIFDFGNFRGLITCVPGWKWQSLVWFDTKNFSGDGTQANAEASEISSVLELALALEETLDCAD